jgi:5-(carboxyamino)imidazole ribonucleotide synthase
MKIGILGGGQLARMLALAGIPLGFRFVIYDPSADCGAAALGKHIKAEYEDQNQLEAFAREVDVVTYEFENVPLASVSFVSSLCPVYPEANALAATQDRLEEKQLFQKLNIPTARFYDIPSITDLYEIGKSLGYPFLIKTRSGGYDGKGQFTIQSEKDIETLSLDLDVCPAIAEELVSFSREISIIAVRRKDGHTAYYDLAENQHDKGILRMTIPKPADPFHQKAKDYIQKLLEHMDYCGVLALELFQIEDKLLANEFAPRVHNTGHWTIEGAATSQFENHLRAIMDLPLGQTNNIDYSGMINLIGKLPDMKETLMIPACYFHNYDKQAKPGRKIGHLTLKSNEPTTFEVLTRHTEKLNVA